MATELVKRNGRLNVPRGSDKVVHWRMLKDEDGSTTDLTNREDITSWSFAFKVKRRDSDADPALITVTSFTVADPLTGEADMTLTSAQTATLKGDYRYSLWRTNAGAAEPLSAGYFTVTDTAGD